MRGRLSLRKMSIGEICRKLTLMRSNIRDFREAQNPGGYSALHSGQNNPDNIPTKRFQRDGSIPFTCPVSAYQSYSVGPGTFNYSRNPALASLVNLPLFSDSVSTKTFRTHRARRTQSCS